MSLNLNKDEVIAAVREREADKDIDSSLIPEKAGDSPLRADEVVNFTPTFPPISL